MSFYYNNNNINLEWSINQPTKYKGIDYYYSLIMDYSEEYIDDYYDEEYNAINEFIPSKLTNLSNKDYTLCSPLISDKVDAFVSDQFTLFLAGGKMRFWMRRT